MRILPTVQDKWVSLHQSFGHICWCDDEQLRKEFMNLNNIDFLCLGDLTNEEKQMLQDKVSVLLLRLGIPCLSEVVTREVTRYGLTDSSYMNSLVRWALPYAQRYIYSMHPNEYSQLKLSGFKNLNSLKIVVVDKLFYKYVIKRFGIKTNNLSECTCLLHDNILYATRKVDSHLLFMELSRFLLSGIPEFHLANFLYVITTKAQSGFTEEKMEVFITNRQKLPNLPCEELRWSLASTSSSEVESTTTKKLGKNSSISDTLSNHHQKWNLLPGFDKTKLDVAEGLFESEGDWIIDEDPASAIPLVIQPQGLDNGKNIVSVIPKNVKTGRDGEREAFRHFSAEHSDKKVKWVNKVKESGLPYDIVVEGKDNSMEYIEVKSTSKAKKDWFDISVNEWKLAVEKGESFSIARVVLLDGKPPKITTYKDLEKLCQSRQLQLAVHVSK